MFQCCNNDIVNLNANSLYKGRKKSGAVLILLVHTNTHVAIYLQALKHVAK